MTAVNKSPWVRNILGASEPLIILGKVQAGSSQAIKAGEICVYNETSGYFVPANAAADLRYGLAISNEEQKAADSARYMEFIGIRDSDVFEFVLAAADTCEYGDALTLTASDSQMLTYDADGLAVAFVVGRQNYPETGVTLRSITYAEVSFRRECSYYYRNVSPINLPGVLATTSALTLALEHNGFIITNKGATQSVTITAPNAVVPVGWSVKLMACADQNFVFDPKPDTSSVFVQGAEQGDGKTCTIADIGDFMHLVWDGTDWLCYANVGGADGDIAVES